MGGEARRYDRVRANPYEMRRMGGSRNAAGVAEAGYRRWRGGRLRGKTRGAAKAENMGAGALRGKRRRRFRTTRLIRLIISSAGPVVLRKKILRADRICWARSRRPRITTRISTNSFSRESKFPPPTGDESSPTISPASKTSCLPALPKGPHERSASCAL